MRNILFIILTVPILLIGYQNCGQLSPVHGTGSDANSSRVDSGVYFPGSNNPYGTDTIEEDLVIQATATPALVVWGNQCQACHANRAISSFSEWGDAIYNATSQEFSIVNQRIRFRHGNRLVNMPTNTTLSANEQDDLMNWVNAIIAKKDKIDNDVQSCVDNSKATFSADINPLLSRDMIDYNGQMRNCLDCHSGNNAALRLDGTAAERLTRLSALSYPRKPEASILHDTLRPGDGSNPTSYHVVPDAEIDKIKEWILGCLAD